MEHNHHQRIKFIFSIVSLALVIIIAAGSFFVHTIFAEYEKVEKLEQGTPESRAQEAAWREREGLLVARDYYYQYYLDRWEGSERRQARSAGSPVITPASSIPVLVYHGILDRPHTADPLNVTMDAFFDQMRTLHQRGWRTLTLGEYKDFIEGKSAVADRSFLLTFDDGRKDSFYPADPLLELLDYHAVIYLITKYAGRTASPYYLDRDELEFMLRSGRWDIQPHGHAAHEYITIDEKGTQRQFLTNIMMLPSGRMETVEGYTRRVRGDLEGSAAWVKTYLGVAPYSFALPFGDYGQRESNLPDAQQRVLGIASSLYSFGFYQTGIREQRVFNTPHQGFLQKRIEVEPGWTGAYLADFLEAGRPHALPFTPSLTRDYDWIRLWGDVTAEGDGLTIGAATSTTGGSAIVAGGGAWKNYEFLTDIASFTGDRFTLFARYRDEGNHTACVYSPAGVEMRERRDGKDETLLSWHRTIDPLEFENFRAGVYVRDTIVRCVFVSTYILRTHRGTPAQGTVGFQAWGAKPHAAELKIKNVVVRPAE